VAQVQLHPLAQEALQQHGEVVEPVVEVQHLRPQGLAAGEGEQLAHQARGPVGVLLDLHDVLEGRIRGPVVGQQQVAVADDRLEHVVEVVGHAARELATAFIFWDWANCCSSWRCSVVSRA
jgi:uncharacterized protein YPO0396